jgi:LacI family transcriptional regulator
VRTARPTLQDVARAAKVSVFTASRAIRGGDGVSPATVTRVREAAREIGYIPNHVARALRGEGTRTFGVLTANTANRYFATLLQAVTVVARDNDYQVLTSDAVEDGEYRVELESAFVQTMLRSRVSGVIVTYALAEENLRVLTQFGIPAVIVDAPSPPGYQQIPFVWTDNCAGGQQAGEHFGLHGYGRWVLVGHTPTWASRIGRQQGFLAAAAQHGADVEVLEGGNTSPSAYEAVAEFLRAKRGSPEMPDALFATNELLLHGALSVLAETGLRSGRDIAVIGFDDFDWAPLLDPPVTVVDQHITAMGTQAARLLVSMLEHADSPASAAVTGGSPEGRSVVLPPQLVIRGSCGCHRADPHETQPGS